MRINKHFIGWGLVAAAVVASCATWFFVSEWGSVSRAREPATNPDTVPTSIDDLRLLQDEVRHAAGAVRSAVVAVRAPSSKTLPSSRAHHESGAESGVIISEDGLVLSQYHV
jgi:hypothetical protein